MRSELTAQGTEVLSLHVVFMDTDMARGMPGAKASPDEVAQMTFTAWRADKPRSWLMT